MTLKITKKRHQITFFSILTATVLLTSAFTAIPPAYSQTLVFQDDYSDNTDWVQVGTGVTVNDPSFPDIVKFNLVADGTDRRVHTAIGTTLSDTEWILESEFLVNTHSNNPGHNVFALSAGTQNTILTDQDMIGLYYTQLGDPGVGLHVVQKDGTNALTFEGSKIILGIGEQVYIRLARTSDTTALFEVFSDAARTQHVTGSPVAVTGILPTIVGLNTLQHANDLNGGSGRNLTAEIDNTSIFDGGASTCNGLAPTITIATAGDDVIIGTPGNDVIVGLDGDDIIYGMGGDDTICGNEGNDFVRAGTGDDLILGDGGKDVLLGDEGNDTIRGNAGNDRLVGGSGEDKLRGGNGNDVLVGGTEDDDLDGQDDEDFCDVSDPTDTTTSCESTT